MNVARPASYNELMAALVEASARIIELEAELALVRAELARVTGRPTVIHSVAEWALSYGLARADERDIDEW